MERHIAGVHLSLIIWERFHSHFSMSKFSFKYLKISRLLATYMVHEIQYDHHWTENGRGLGEIGQEGLVHFSRQLSLTEIGREIDSSSPTLSPAFQLKGLLKKFTFSSPG